MSEHLHTLKRREGALHRILIVECRRKDASKETSEQ